ncbi:MAG: 4-(cytidine 5'-diphospho)-2-C-methyl-D-erythritol kinase [Muribaculum sp.]|nr:4-(cytidine 5'-diphospho)-2-C-methyl-D-erythritol kinase [Muribaculum sp.]
MILFPNAKINLGLNITTRRPDGYHDLTTVFYPVGWTDVLEIVPAKGSDTTLTVTGRCVACRPDDNLVMKAYRLMAENYELPPVDIFLHKNIPDGAGLGGGSSDASFTLRGLNELFGLGVSDTQLASLARRLGADCPFFIYNRPLSASGIGDVFEPVDISLADYDVLVVKPPVSIPTREAFKWIAPHMPPEIPSQTVTLVPPVEWQGRLVNDFEASVFPAHPEVERLVTLMRENGALYASMSGSGAAVYGIWRRDGSDRMSALAGIMPDGYAVWHGRFE